MKTTKTVTTAVLMLAVALNASSALAYTPDPLTICKIVCWTQFKSQLAECVREFPYLQDPLRKTCGDGALAMETNCITACDKNLPQIVYGAMHVLFVPSHSGSPTGYVHRVNNSGPQTSAVLTTMNAAGNGTGGLTHIRIKVNGSIVYENTNYANTKASQTTIDLAPGLNTVAIESSTAIDSMASIWITNSEIADPADL